MHLQTLNSPNTNLYPAITSTRYFNPFPVTDSFTKSFSNSKFKNGFCRFRKRVSESPIVLRNHGGLIGIRCEGSREKDDWFYMRRAVELAKKAIGCTSPNPMVGCVIVKNGEVVGEGFHPKAGQPHAEVFALRDAGDLAENATAYVSLEPCNHYGRTPPCTEALIRAKVKRVVVGMVDPNPIVASKGVDRLRDSGIDVTVGVEEELCKNLNEAYIHRMLTGKPFVTLRYSRSLNGQILDQVGLGAKESGGYYSQLLQEYDGVILSSASLTENSTFPTSQEPQAKQPLQIIVARTPKSPVQIPLLTTDAATQVIIFAEKDTEVNPETSQQGIETVVLDKVNLNAILDYCGRRGLCSILVDVTGKFGDLEELVEEGLEQGLVQKVVMEIFSSWDGRKEIEIQTLKDLEREVINLRKLQSTSSKESVLMEGYFLLNW
ncbi:CMP/dCMP deaminase [Macleaya cordata]|uniref:Riboflavin biosynthesis protein PYRD, chloroplastic n=1 Tax=Macleaya cordata TaxID=56857 RepID=A0A200QUB6_MACCD|nr:CMP/dCMP deaminase [Macleaya cordata]